MTPAQLSRAIRHTLPRVLPGGGADDLRARMRVVVEAPPRRGDGDYATGVAFQAAAACGRPASEVAEALAARLVRDEEAIAAAEVVGAGFVNVTLTPAGRTALLRTLTESAPGGVVAECALVGHASAESASVGHGSAEAVSAGHGSTEPAAGGAPAGSAPPVETLAPLARPAPPAPSEAPAPPAHPTPTDHPAQDIARWAEVTGEDSVLLAVRTERCSSLFRVQYA
ncbi:hypothetical protein JW592_32120, partial [Streptomyces sp. DW4-2]|nr:hypothetical protein [Streptomyces spirodelae]